MHPDSSTGTRSDFVLTPELRKQLLAPLPARGKPRPALDTCLGLSYGRVSKSMQLSIPDQHRAAKRLAVADGVTIETELDDEGPRWDNDRAGYVRLKELAASGRYSHIYLCWADRLGGDDVEFVSTVRHLLRMGLKVRDTVNGTIDDNNVGILGFLSHMEIKRDSERTIMALEGRAARGVKLGRPRLGYKAACTEHPCRCGLHGHFVPDEQASAVTELFHRYARGEPLEALQRWFNSETGLKRLPSQLRDLLRDPFYWGLIVNCRERNSKVLGRHRRAREEWEVSEKLHEHPLIDKQTWDTVQARLQSGQPPRMHAARRTQYSLSGLVWCKRCNRRMTPHRASSLELRCNTCHLTRGYRKVESAIRQCLDRIAVPADGVAGTAALDLEVERRSVEAELARIDQELARLARRRQNLMIREADAEDDQERSEARAAYRATDVERAQLVAARGIVEGRLTILPGHSTLMATVLNQLEGCSCWTSLLDGADVAKQQEVYRQSISRGVVDQQSGELLVEFTAPVARWCGRLSDTVPLPSQKAHVNTNWPK